MQNDFSSLDKLVEFGLGLNVATQMMNTMNQAMANTAVAGVGINPGVSQAPGSQVNAPQTEYFIVVEGRQAGPFSAENMELLIEKNILTRQTLCWRQGMQAWMFAEDVPDINKIFVLYGLNNDQEV